jgi:putative hydrolase of the HAD superfamily
MQPRCLLIDAMGTLVRLQPPAPTLRDELRRRFGIDVSLQQAQAAMVAEIRYYRAHMLEGRDPASSRELARRSAEAMRPALAPHDLDGAGMTEALLACLQFSVFDDAVSALQAVRAQGLRVVVVSNWDWSLGERLARLGLACLLDGVVTSAVVGAGKPDPAIFYFALQVAGVQAGQALHVGDSLEEDVVGARAAGISVAWLNRADARGEPPPGVPVIASLAELGRLL